MCLTFTLLTCLPLFLALQLLVTFMLTMAGYAVNFALPYCYTNLVAWPIIFAILFVVVWHGFWNWNKNDVEGNIIENDQNHPENLAITQSVRSFNSFNQGATVAVGPTSLRGLASQSFKLTRAVSWRTTNHFTDNPNKFGPPIAQETAIGPEIEMGMGVALGSFQTDINIHLKGWGNVPHGHICCGPGLLYINDPTICLVDEDVVDEDAAKAKVDTYNQQYPENPIVLWQLGNPWSNGSAFSSLGGEEDKYYFIGMKLPFMKMTNVALIDKNPEAYAKMICSYQPGCTWGGPLWFAKT